MAKTFTKFGLKRDLNLADLPDKKAALNNILDELRGGKESFTWEDIEVLKNINLTSVTKDTFTDASDATVKQVTSNGTLQIYDPLITLENRFDKAYFTTSEPFFAGGDGLTADYYDNNTILRQTPGNPSTTFNGFNTAAITKTDNFWERGNFVYGNKIIVELLSLYGGVQWSGYFKPSADGEHKLRVYTSGFVKIEFDDKTQSREFTFDASTGTFNYNNTDFTKMTVLADQTRLNQISDLETATIVGTTNKLGEERTIEVSLGSLSQWEAYKIRISYFIDEEAIPAGSNVSKSINIDISSPDNLTFTDIDYKRLYTKDYFTAYDIGDFRAFIENSVTRAGTEVGLQGTVGDVKGTYSSLNQNGDSYKNVTNFNPIVSYYQFPKSLSEVETSIAGCNVVQSNTNIKIANAQPNSTEGIEVGNYIFGTGIPVGCRVVKVIINDSIEVYPAPSGTASSTSLTFVDHRGLVGFGTGAVAQNGVTSITNGFNLSDIGEDQILLSSGLSMTYDDQRTSTNGISVVGRIVKSYASNQITFKNVVASTAIGTQRFYVYQSYGLNNDGLKFYCTGAFAKRIRAGNGNNGSNFTYTNTGASSITIRLDDVEGLQNGMYAHLFPTLNYDSRLSGSVTELYSRITITNISGNDVTLTRSGGGSVLLADLNYIPTVITRITFTAVGDDVNREVCFVPTDTSPPFSASPIGLTTNFNVAMVNTFSSKGGGSLNPSGKVIYSALEVKHNTGDVSSNVLTYTNQTVSNYLPIEDNNGTIYYMMLGS